MDELEPSALDEATRRIGDRWTLLLLDALGDGPRRFGELSDLVPGIAPNVLTSRLRQLESDGLVAATPYSTRPRRLAYALTDDGRELGGALALLRDWGRRRLGPTAAAGDPDAPRHRTCGTALVTRLWCPTCERPVDDPDDHELVHL
jgi:DNA-binding HxlR family transcriptional regulator